MSTVAGQGIRRFVGSFCLEVMHILSDYILLTNKPCGHDELQIGRDVQSYHMPSRKWEPEYVWGFLNVYPPVHSCHFSLCHLLETSFSSSTHVNSTNPSKAISKPTSLLKIFLISSRRNYSHSSLSHLKILTQDTHVFLSWISHLCTIFFPSTGSWAL